MADVIGTVLGLSLILAVASRMGRRGVDSRPADPGHSWEEGVVTVPW